MIQKFDKECPCEFCKYIVKESGGGPQKGSRGVAIMLDSHGYYYSKEDGTSITVVGVGGNVTITLLASAATTIAKPVKMVDGEHGIEKR